jgi:hypothetical protein
MRERAHQREPAKRRSHAVENKGTDSKPEGRRAESEGQKVGVQGERGAGGASEAALPLPVIAILAKPSCNRQKNGAGDETRTRDPQLGRLML